MNTEEALLTGAVDYENYDTITQDIDNKEVEITTSSELKTITKSSIPLVFTFFMQYFLSVTSIYAAGKLGAKELAACSLAVCTFNITGLATFRGMATSLDTFCSQAFGSGNKTMVGVYFQRCSLMILTITIPLIIIWFNSEAILVKLVPDPELAKMAATFLKIHTIGAPGLIFFETGKRFLQAQHIFEAGTYVLVIVAPVNFILNWILVWHPRLGLGYIGLPIAISITYWLISLFMLGYVVFINGKQCWGGLDIASATRNWKPMLSLAIPGVIMVIAEFLAFEVLTILAASFGTESLAAQSIVSNVAALFFQMPFAVAVVLSTRIGHFVGNENIRGAKINTNLFCLLGGLLGLFNFSVMFFGRTGLSKLFTQDPKVLESSKALLTLAAINQIGDAFNVIATGVLRGQGRQQIGSILYMTSYYLIALPLGYIFAFPMGLHLNGLWLGLMSGVGFLAISCGIVAYWGDWEKILRDSKGIHDD
ncbi:uncharacterized protein J8A68_002609 [[Candida] subhashii]|uniref:MATE efflux family protein n=1 Tax=[Candida] subhashii TaxID=561895 RepID=A0A8J5UXU1_9ASCO|nr:uncharacterized protein J8A68_002609 [[Candida] subhashii]KAG7663860.1 hypothetical protein J8A68_002609 [[Candida] subhashii]